MQDSNFNRRRLLKLTGVGVGGAALATTSVGAQTDSIDIRYASQATTPDTTSNPDIPTDDGEGVITSQNIELEVTEELELTPETVIRVQNTDTGAELDIAIEETQTVPSGNSVSLARGTAVYGATGEIESADRANIKVMIDEDAFEFTDVDVTPEGDFDVFTGGSAYDSYQIELRNNEGQFAATDEHPIGIGVERGFIQQKGTDGEIDCSISFVEPLAEEFHVEFDAAGFAAEGFSVSETVVDDSGSNELEWTTDISESDPGTYSGWRVTVLPDAETPDDQRVIAFGGRPSTPADGITVEDDADTGVPSEIADWNDLNDIRTELDGEYELVNDLDENTAGYNEFVDRDGGFEPIGNKSAFTGTFDGNGNEIADIVIDRPDEESVGLFGTADDAVIEDIMITGAEITGEGDVGTTVGTAEGSTVVETVTASGTVEGFDDEIGGVVGQSRNAVVVSDADSAVDVTGRDDVGGVVGENDDEAIIRNSVASGTVEWRPDGADITFAIRLGGVVGENDGSDARVENCRSEADVNVRDEYEFDEESDANGSVYIGNIAGGNDGVIKECTATGTVTLQDNPDSNPEEGRGTSNRIGGIVGNNGDGDPQPGVVRRCFSDTVLTADNITGPSGGGIAGTNFGDIEDCYATGSIDVTDSESLPEIGGLVGENSGGFANNGVIERCFAVVALDANTVDDTSANVGGVIGDNRPDTVAANLYWDTEASSVEEGISGEGGDITNIVGLSTAETQGEAAAENMAALDFDETWDVVTDPDGYPILRFQDDPEDELPEQAELTIQPLSIADVGPEDSFSVAVTVEETAGLAAEDPEITLTITPDDSDTTSYNGTFSTGELAADAETTVTFGEDEATPEVGPLTAGEYEATAEVAAANAETVSTSESFTVSDEPDEDPTAEDFITRDEAGNVEDVEVFDAIDAFRGDQLESGELFDVISAFREA